MLKELQLDPNIIEILEKNSIDFFQEDSGAIIGITREGVTFGEIELNFTNLPKDLSDFEIETLDITSYKIDQKDFVEQLKNILSNILENKDDIIWDVFNNGDEYVTVQGCTDLVNEMIDDLSKSCLEIEKLAQQELSSKPKKQR